MPITSREAEGSSNSHVLAYRTTAGSRARVRMKRQVKNRDVGFSFLSSYISKKFGRLDSAEIGMSSRLDHTCSVGS